MADNQTKTSNTTKTKAAATSGAEEGRCDQGEALAPRRPEAQSRSSTIPRSRRSPRMGKAKGSLTDDEIQGALPTSS